MLFQTPQVRAMREDDLAAVLAVQAACYPPAMQEAAAVLLARLRAAPATTLVACCGGADAGADAGANAGAGAHADAADTADTAAAAHAAAAVCAYVFAYPSLPGRVTPLGAPFALPAAPDTLYLHDLAVAPQALGRGLARRLAAALLAPAAALGLRQAALVSVQDSRQFWEGLGYREAHGRPRCAALATYPADAVYMTRAL
jgi:ribosomal protein S18 acetylase RimI-like enzyme